MIESKDLLAYAKEQRQISVAQVQMHFEETYSHARKAVENLVQNNFLKYEGGITYKYVGDVKNRKVEEVPIVEEDEDDDEDDIDEEALKEFYNKYIHRSEVELEKKIKQARDWVKDKPSFKNPGKPPTAPRRRREELRIQVKICFDRLNGEAQALLQSALIENSEVAGRIQLYVIMRRKGDELSADNKEYETYNSALSFLLQLPEEGFAEFKKYAMSKI